MTKLHVAASLALALTFSACGYNDSAVADQKVKQSWADVEVAYQRRANLVPNLVQTVQAAATFESSTIAAVTAARASATQVKLTAEDLNDPAKLEAFQKAQAQLSQSLGRLLAVSENYPDLKATQGYRDLMTELEGCENRIATEVHKFNKAVAEYNSVVLVFPSSIGSALRGYKERPTFKADDGAEKVPQVQFNR